MTRIVAPVCLQSTLADVTMNVSEVASLDALPRGSAPGGTWGLSFFCYQMTVMVPLTNCALGFIVTLMEATMTQEQIRNVNIFATAILDTLGPEGIPEGHLYIAAEKAGCNPDDAISLLILGGLLDRREGPVIVPGPKFAAVKANLACHRASL